MPRRFKDQVAGGHPVSNQAPAPPPAASSENAGGPSDYAATPERKKPRRAQLSDSASGVRVSPIQFRQVIVELRNTTPERKITERTGVSEIHVRYIRSLYMSMPERHMSVLGLLFDQFFAGVRSMQADISQGIYEEVNERVA